MKITEDGAVIDGAVIHGTLVIAAGKVVVRNSKIFGTVDSDNGASVTIEDSEVHAGTTSAAAIGYHQVTVRRTEVTGGQHSVNCGTSCVVEDSWLHDQALPADQPFHNNAYISNGGTGVVVRGNTLECTPRDNSVGGGCSGDLSLFGDFAPIRDVKIVGNLFRATPGGYCGTFGHSASKAFGAQSENVTVSGNVFERGSGKCGYWGPVTSFHPVAGGVFTGNVWDDGGSVAAAD